MSLETFAIQRSGPKRTTGWPGSSIYAFLSNWASEVINMETKVFADTSCCWATIVRDETSIILGEGLNVLSN